MRNLWPAILLLSLLAGVTVELVARIVAQLAVAEGSLSIPNSLGNTFASVWTPLPIAIAAGSAARAAHMYGARSVALVLPLGLAPHAYWTYKAQCGAILALADGRWTAAALGSGFAWIFSVVLVTLAGGVGLFIARVLYEEPSDGS